MTDIEPTELERSYPGVTDGAFGLAGHPDEFKSLALRTEAAIGVAGIEVTRDYWLTACLHGVVAAGGADGLVTSGQGCKEAPLAKCAFSGGTSLVSAWGITERYSEDLDILALVLDETGSTSAHKRPLSVVSKWTAAAIGLSKQDISIVHMNNVGFRRTFFNIGGNARFLKIETTVEACQEGLCETRPVTSLMGRFATAEELAQYPELGGFEMLCVTPAYTAANKFDALHRRAVTGDLRGLVIRGRDLYDLASIAASEHAESARSAIPDLAARAALSPGSRENVARPPGGYAQGILFRFGSESQEALRDGYDRIGPLIWGDVPPFDDAIELAASLDSR